MEEYIYTIRAYLPVEFEDQESNEFIDYLVAAYLENLPTEKFQFSYTAFHMLYMSYIFKVKWFLKQLGEVTIEASLNALAQQYKYKFNTLFDLSQINEKTSLEKLLLGLSFHVNEIGICKNFVDVRNNCSHASGKIYYKKASQVEHYILEAIDNIKVIQKKVKPQIRAVFEKFIVETSNKNWIETEIKEWILKNYFSQMDIEEIFLFRPNFLQENSDTKEIVFKKILYSALVSELVNYVDDKGDYFSKSLTFLMKGLSSQIDIKKNPGDAPRMKSTQEIIEEKIVPILTNLSNEEAIKAQQILKFKQTA